MTFSSPEATLRCVVKLPGVHPSNKMEGSETPVPITGNTVPEGERIMYLCPGEKNSEEIHWESSLGEMASDHSVSALPILAKTDVAGISVYPYIPDGHVPQGFPATPLCLPLLPQMMLLQWYQEVTTPSGKHSTSNQVGL